MIRTLLKPFSFVPAILLMYMIYNFSAQPAEVSSQVSWKVTYQIVYTVDEALDAGMADWEIETWAYRIHGFVRKLAHMTEYFALAVAVSFPLYVYGVRGIWLMLLAGLICVGFACGDEYHQSFVEGRGPSRRDVMIDSIGALIGILLVRIIGWTGRMTIFRPRKKRTKTKKETRRRNRYAAPEPDPCYPEHPYEPAPEQFRQQPVEPVPEQLRQQPFEPVPEQFRQQPVEPAPEQFRQQSFEFQEPRPHQQADPYQQALRAYEKHMQQNYYEK